MTIGRIGLVGLLLAAVAAFYAPRGASAAQINISNCQATKVRICSYDNQNTTKNDGSHNLAEGEQGHFTCDANCSFIIVNCTNHPSCDDCKKNGHWLDDGWSKGTYNLVALDQKKNPEKNFVTADLQKTDSTEICQ